MIKYYDYNYLTNTQGNHNKFYEVMAYEDEEGRGYLFRRYGPIGRVGTIKKERSSTERAVEDALRLKRQKERGGYVVRAVSNSGQLNDSAIFSFSQQPLFERHNLPAITNNPPIIGETPTRRSTTRRRTATPSRYKVKIHKRRLDSKYKTKADGSLPELKMPQEQLVNISQYSIFKLRNESLAIKKKVAKQMVKDKYFNTEIDVLETIADMHADSFYVVKDGSQGILLVFTNRYGSREIRNLIVMPRIAVERAKTAMLAIEDYLVQRNGAGTGMATINKKYTNILDGWNRLDDINIYFTKLTKTNLFRSRPSNNFREIIRI